MTTISSLVVRAHPARLHGVRAALAAMPGIEIRADCGDGRFVVVLDGAAPRSARNACARLHDIEGILDVSLVYQYCDDALPQEPQA